MNYGNKDKAGLSKTRRQSLSSERVLSDCKLEPFTVLISQVS